MHFKSRKAVEATVSAAETNLQAAWRVNVTNTAVLRLRTVALLMLFAHPLLGGVVFDGSLGNHVAGLAPFTNSHGLINFMIPANYGTQKGGNLFQSFSQFNLNSSQSATFTGPANVHNILARVTSGSPSSIDGTIKTDPMMGDPNLFFMNPAGVIFGKHAQLDLKGSFGVTTANYLKLAGGGRFNANLGGGDVLRSAPVSAFGFLNAAPASVSVTGSTLSVAPRKSLSTIGGNITMNGGTISGAGSRVNLVSVKSAGEVQLDATDLDSAIDVSGFTTLGEIDLTNLTKINVSGPQGGGAVVRSGNLYLNNSQLTSETTGTSDGLPFDIALSAELKIVNGAFIFTDTLGSGSGSNLSIHAKSLSIDGSASLGLFTGIAAQSSGPATGNAGNIAIAVDQALSIVAEGEISNSTLSSGKGGNLMIHAGSLSIDGSAAMGYFTGIDAVSSPKATADAGNLTITVDQALSVVGSGRITATTFSSGNGGNVTIHAGSLSIDGSATPNEVTGIVADSDAGATGNAGDLFVDVDGPLSIANAGQISAGTFSSGTGGSLTVRAQSLSVDGSATPYEFTGISVQSNSTATGNAGDLTINVQGPLNITAAGEISADTFSSGHGGDLMVHAGSILIDGSATPAQVTGILVDSLEGATGNAGDLSVIVDRALRITGSGQITADTGSSGRGGDLNVHAGSILIDGSALPDLFTGISADALEGGTGNAGDLSVIVDQALTITGSGQITADTSSSGRGGDLSVHAGSILIDGSALPDLFTGISADALEGSGDGGNLTVTVAGSLSIRGGGEISAGTFSSGRGGDLVVRARSILIDGSAALSTFTGITGEASDGTGNGGDVKVKVSGPLKIIGSGEISTATFTSGRAGNVTVNAQRLVIDGAGSQGFSTDISAQSEEGATGEAGDIALNVSGAVRLRSGASIVTDSAGDGGNITIRTPGLVYVTDSSITATAGGNGESGRGGNITIDPQFIVLNNSLISANAAVGQGGNINLISDFFFNSNSSITATGTTNGIVNITAPALDLGAELITLPTSLLSAESQLQERCTALLQGDFSSFISIGRGGTEPAPEELQSSF